MADLSWFFARPIAHRGLHDAEAGRVENTITAAGAAIAMGFGIECDVQLTADGEAVVFHDFDLDRLTGCKGPVAAQTAAELGRVSIGGTADVVPTLADFLSFIDGRVPLIVEVKSRHDGDLRLARRVVEILGNANARVAAKSFDPDVVTELKRIAPQLRRGIVGQSHYDEPEKQRLEAERIRLMTDMLHFDETQPDFVSWRAGDLPAAAPYLARLLAGTPVMTWTIRNAADARRVLLHADQIVFEGFVPDGGETGAGSA